MNQTINTNSERAQLARLAKTIGSGGYHFCHYGFYVVGSFAAVLLLSSELRTYGYLLAAVAVILFMIAVWYKRHLSNLQPTGSDITNRLTSEALGLLPKPAGLSPQTIWKSYGDHWQSRFFTNRLLLHADSISQLLSPQEVDSHAALQKADELSGGGQSAIDIRHIVAALLLTSESVMSLCQRLKLRPEDILSTLAWISRAHQQMQTERPYYGGIGRDWASGFTPKLNVFGSNLSRSIQRQGVHFGTLVQSPGVQSLRGALAQKAPLIGLIGDTGAGKTSHVYALAQSLLAEAHDPKLRHKQIVGLDATSIISHAQQPGELERIVALLLNEASHAGNIILFLDNASLFFAEGHGSFDATKLLQPLAESGSLQVILAMTPQDQQGLRSSNPDFASNITPVVLQEPDTATTIQILQDVALGFEQKHQAFITYQAIQETAPLSDRYIQDLAQPGRAIRLLEQSLAYPEQSLITEHSIKQSIEATQGVKLSSASAEESSKLLNLEDELHKRMINQTRAVSVVSSALRRARAGVTNPDRPMGSFLFLGPTGVGKTELAKALSATCFGSQDAIIRLDMSEYQNESDVNRLLSDGSGTHTSLLMSIRQQPYSVVLLDEIEKAHPNILNLLLQLLDEGQLTDAAGKKAFFRDAIIIATSNAGSASIRQHIEAGEQLETFEKTFTDELITSQQFKPELLNRFDEIVLFRPLAHDELAQVVGLMVQDVNKTLGHQNISVQLSPEAVTKIVQLGYDPRLGARPMRRVVQRTIEDTVAKAILRKELNPGDSVTLHEADIASD